VKLSPGLGERWFEVAPHCGLPARDPSADLVLVQRAEGVERPFASM